MHNLKVAVIGTGYLGKFHAQKYFDHHFTTLSAICDIDEIRAHKLSKKYNCRAVTDFRELLGKVDAVSIAVPTSLHHEICKPFLEHGIHVLLEKPITKSVSEAEELVKLAKEKNVVFQIGHLERFNPVFKQLHEHITLPRFIESTRIAPFNPRGTDVNVILDLMIHDIDLIQSLLDSPIKEIQAAGSPVLSQYNDIANARILFENACVANVTASRISLKSERKLRIFQNDAYISIDMHNNKMAIHKKGEGEMYPGVPNVKSDFQSFDKVDVIRDEIHAFINSIIKDKPASVTGEDGLRALVTAMRITDLVKSHTEWANTIHPIETPELETA